MASATTLLRRSHAGSLWHCPVAEPSLSPTPRTHRAYAVLSPRSSHGLLHPGRCTGQRGGRAGLERGRVPVGPVRPQSGLLGALAKQVGAPCTSPLGGTGVAAGDRAPLLHIVELFCLTEPPCPPLPSPGPAAAPSWGGWDRRAAAGVPRWSRPGQQLRAGAGGSRPVSTTTRIKGRFAEERGLLLGLLPSAAVLSLWRWVSVTVGFVLESVRVLP